MALTHQPSDQLTEQLTEFWRIVVISSINGQKGQFAQVNYAATKAGDLGIVKSLAQEIARCVAFLTSDDAGFLNGSTISANGAQFFS